VPAGTGWLIGAIATCTVASTASASTIAWTIPARRGQNVDR
jgi:hypothetical protein